MIFLIPLITLTLGICIGYLIKIPLQGQIASYISICALAALDTLFGGIRSLLEKKFYVDVFLTGFFANTLITFFLAWLGDSIGLNMFLAIAIILGGRIFTNLSMTRRYLLNAWHLYLDNQSSSS